jgi:hypothetical protein
MSEKKRCEGMKLLVLPLYKQHVVSMGKHLNCTKCGGNVFGMSLIKAACLYRVRRTTRPTGRQAHYVYYHENSELVVRCPWFSGGRTQD